MSTVLLAIDETHLASRLTNTLKDAGWAVVCVGNGYEAYRTARSIRPDLIVADYRLAQLGGLELCTKLHNDRVTCDTPVVLLTARGFGTPSTSHLSNVKRVLTKPISPHAMLSLARTLVQNRLIGAGV
ncbi:MAG TPA: response regulator [Phycisphaerae bacterium]|nr:response regulator [Phycisphaerae bacterium]HOJ73624.1 response regulator [Phycisphaerae bacterium]HOM51567.1 response regulator [Phycisphaerae bacterium]HON67150.1 response regulator [Phycisphaerae bacterium]HOQ87399.1 response regulator [Phycisphaerae bacterium]